jgi:hypothetical protein
MQQNHLKQLEQKEEKLENYSKHHFKRKKKNISKKKRYGY